MGVSETTPLLQIEGLRAGVGDIEILKGVDLTVDEGEIHALMGPNGSGKSTLANVLMGHPIYKVTAGRILYKGEDMTTVSASRRGAAGMFLAFQHPEAIPGVSVIQFLRQALSNRTGVDLTVLELRLKVMDAMKELGMETSFADRYLNEGFSGGSESETKFSRWRCSSPTSPSWTRPTPGSTSTPFEPSPTGSTSSPALTAGF